LQINAVEPFGWAPSKGGIQKRVLKPHTPTAVKKEDRTEKTGGYNVKPNTKVGFNTGACKQSTNYNNQNSYPCSNAFSMGPKFTHTGAGAGQWWEVPFNQGYWVDRVRVLNRRDCCGSRLHNTKVMIDNQLCG